MICRECQGIVDCIATLKVKIAQLAFNRQKEVAEVNILDAESRIMDWQRHIMRGVQQSKARADAFSNLNEISGIWTRPTPMKNIKLQSVYHIILLQFKILAHFRDPWSPNKSGS